MAFLAVTTTRNRVQAMICRRFACGVAMLLAFLDVGIAGEPVRVGILGFDNYQAVEYAAFFNNPKAEGDLAGLRVTAAYPVTSPDYPESAALTARWQEQ